LISISLIVRPSATVVHDNNSASVGQAAADELISPISRGAKGLDGLQVARQRTHALWTAARAERDWARRSLVKARPTA
jgi:predicted HD phosphohydrolase